tara:strand:- start:79 stop:1086 length:1008 start_codon:yes stop_codon:yes gene_type:complete
MKIIKKLENNKYKADFLIVGSGNIAKRHLKNALLINKKSKIIILKRFNSKTDKFFLKKSFLMCNSLDNIEINNGKSIAIICSPAPYHIEDAIKLIKKGFHVLIEKPLTTMNKNINKLVNLKHSYRNKILIGYNMRFTERIQYLSKLLRSKKYKKIKHIDIKAFTDFREWRKDKFFKNTVTFNKNLGGGVINELSHEIDYMNLLFGKPDTVIVNEIKKNINMNVEYHITAFFQYHNKKYSINLELDMLSKQNKRSCDIFFDNKKIIINHSLNKIIINNKEKKFSDNINKSYIKELKHLRKLISNKKIKENFKEFIETQKIIHAMHISLLKNKEVNI